MIELIKYKNKHHDIIEKLKILNPIDLKIHSFYNAYSYSVYANFDSDNESVDL